MSRVFVAGSINMDVVATAERHPRIGETVAGTSVRYFPGGKGANQAVAASKLGAPTTLIGRLGKDAFGRQLKAFLDAQDIDLSYLQEAAEAHTGTALITVADADNTIVVVPGANAQVSAGDIAAPVLTKGDIAVSQFEIPMPTIHAFFERARACGATTILNPAPAREVSRDLLDLVDILILNESELGLLARTDLCDTDDDARIIEAIRSLQPRSDQVICVTLGRRGIVALIDGRPHTDIGRTVKAVDATGAGDCFVGAVAALLAGGQPVRSAFGYANIAASICVERMGAAPSMPTADEVRQILSARRPAERRDDERN